MAVPIEAAMLAFRGSLCLESQYFLGHSSNLFHEDGDIWKSYVVPPISPLSSESSRVGNND